MALRRVAELVLVRPRSARNRRRATHRAVRTRWAQQIRVLRRIGRSRWAVVASQTQTSSRHRAVVRTVESFHAWRTLRYRRQTHRRRVRARRTLHRSRASHGTVVTRRADIVRSHVLQRRTRVARVAHAIRRRRRSRPAFERRRHRAASAAVVSRLSRFMVSKKPFIHLQINHML
jgi:hypothetical protein